MCSFNIFVYSIGTSVFGFAFSVNTNIFRENSFQESLIVGTDLRVEQSFEDLETTFEEGEKFSFDVVLHPQK